MMMRRRAARGGGATPPLRSDDSDDEREGRSTEGRDHPPPETDGVHRRGEDGSGGERSDSGLVNHIHNSETVIVGGASNENNDEVGGANRSSNSALNRLTMDAYGSSDDDD